jgi:solute carrier family 6 amino acid/orphan transporter-like 15/16/17/18/20
MANTAHLVRRQSSQNLNPQRSLDRLEMKELRGRLVVENGNSNLSHNYGATNVAFDDTSPNTKVERTLDFSNNFSRWHYTFLTE